MHSCNAISKPRPVWEGILSETMALSMTSRLVFPLSLWVGLLAVGCTTRGTVNVGGACTIDESCITGACIREVKDTTGTSWRGGYCSGNCGDTPCPQGLCLAFADGHSYCVSECKGASDCRSGYVCSTAAGACLPDCRLGWSCGSKLACDPSTGTCVAPVAQARLGTARTLDAHCLSGLCLPQRPAGR